MSMPPFRAAVAKGRILDEVVALWQAAGWVWPFDEHSRRLYKDPDPAGPGAILVKGDDVPVLVERGIADFGIVGKDILAERHQANVLEVLDLGVGRCRVVLAGRTPEPPHGRVRIATRYPAVTRAYVARKGLMAEVVELHGSVELAPLIGLSPYIVDIVQTGVTLAEHGLVEIETVLPVTARLIANPALWRAKDLAQVRDHLRTVVDRLQAVPVAGTPGKE
ncbi:ATP phosphoribosyltransferase [Candidatus Hydrogenisulfobacillus filiaventi]|uniref:ATP phosphoribosyltransferase n=1 Tax=Candidatus Hydrogenisulfobacillus filiaventi TaxID=2707344 RepID=A0A6F8ZE06_9FIRM|nr:ATP phosphoribosyltransferase [Candidatus Hydrogenisulfobacillus filiaventi]